MTVWVRAPPFDQETQVHVTPPCVCGEGALSVFLELTMTVRANGVGAVIELSPRIRPVGFARRVSVVVLGSSTTLCVAFSPCESVAVNTSSSEDGYSWSGARNEPPATPLKV